MVKRDTIGLHTLVEGFLFSLTADGRSPHTTEYYSKLLKPFERYAVDHGWPDSLETQQVREFLAWVSTRHVEYIAGHNSRRITAPKPVTTWHYYKAIRRLFNWAIEEHLIESSPVANIHFKAPPPTPVMPYDIEALRRLLALCDADVRAGARFEGLRGKATILLYLDTAGRLSEIEAAKMADLDLTRKALRVVGKGNKVDELVFSAKTAKALWSYLQERKKRARCENIFITEEGTAFAQGGTGKWFVCLKKRAGVSGPGRIHRLRHTGAYEFLKSTRDPFLTQLFLRHVDLTMTRRYVQALKREEAIEAHRNGASPVQAMGLG